MVFDVGGVLIALDDAEFKSRMASITDAPDDPAYRAIVEKFETGKLDTAQFVAALRALRPANAALQDADIIASWNSQIGPADCAALRMVRKLKAKGLKTYLLSTTNPLGVKLIEERFRGCFPEEQGDALASLFDQRYYTFELGLLKPSPEIFKKMVKDGGMKAGETLFLDDSPANVIGAQQAGLYSLLVTGPGFSQWLPRLVSAE